MNNLRTLTTMKKALIAAMAVATLAILPATAQAVPIVGTLDLTGAVRVTANGIDWLPPFGEGFGLAVVQPTSTGYFEPLAGEFAVEMDLIGVPVGVQLGTGISGFETFLPDSPLPGLNFILDMILSCGQASLDPADECAAGLDSPFRFDQDTEGTTVIINFRGRVVDPIGAPDEISTFNAKFDATFTGLTPEQILGALEDQGFIDSPYSARKITVDMPTQEVPEPATMLTFGAGTALLAAHRRRRAKKAAK